MGMRMWSERFENVCFIYAYNFKLLLLSLLNLKIIMKKLNMFKNMEYILNSYQDFASFAESSCFLS